VPLCHLRAWHGTGTKHGRRRSISVTSPSVRSIEGSCEIPAAIIVDVTRSESPVPTCATVPVRATMGSGLQAPQKFLILAAKSGTKPTSAENHASGSATTAKHRRAAQSRLYCCRPDRASHATGRGTFRASPRPASLRARQVHRAVADTSSRHCRPYQFGLDA